MMQNFSGVSRTTTGRARAAHVLVLCLTFVSAGAYARAQEEAGSKARAEQARTACKIAQTDQSKGGRGEAASGKADATAAGKEAGAWAESPFAPPPPPAPLTILRTARTVFVKSKSGYVKSSEVENELRKQLAARGLQVAVLKHEESADLVMEIGRRLFSTTFIYSIIEPRSGLLVTSGKVKSLGGTVPDKIAKRFTAELQQARARTPPR